MCVRARALARACVRACVFLEVGCFGLFKRVLMGAVDKPTDPNRCPKALLEGQA